MSLQPITVNAGNYAIKDFYTSEDADFVLPFRMYDDKALTVPSVLTGRTFSFEVFDLSRTSLGVYSIGNGIEVVDNLVTVTIELEDWATWLKNCDLRYELRHTLSTGIRYPLLKGKFRITT